MLVTLNQKGNIEIGFLRARNSKQLDNYRNSLLRNISYNFKIDSTVVEKECGNLTSQTKKINYADGEILVKEEFIDFIKPVIPFETYLYNFKKTNIVCNNLITIQVLTRILNDWYNICDLDIIKEFVQANIMQLIIKKPEAHFPDRFNSHIGIEKLCDPKRKIDLNSFRNSFPFLEYVCTNEFTLSEIVQISCHYCHKYFSNELSSTLNEIAINTEILFNSPNKTLKKVRQ